MRKKTIFMILSSISLLCLVWASVLLFDQRAGWGLCVLEQYTLPVQSTPLSQESCKQPLVYPLLYTDTNTQKVNGGKGKGQERCEVEQGRSRTSCRGILSCWDRSYSSRIGSGPLLSLTIHVQVQFLLDICTQLQQKHPEETVTHDVHIKCIPFTKLTMWQCASYV